jgi:hypothetical protein
MAVDVASREQAWADKSGPELLAACRSALGTLHGRKEEVCIVVSKELRAAIAKAGA